MAQPGGNHSLMPYAGVLAALFVLTVLTVAVARVDFGHPTNDIIALAIAGTKATLVVLFFMHVYESSRLIKVSVVASVVCLICLFFFILVDTMSRNFAAERFGPTAIENADLSGGPRPADDHGGDAHH
ncbi:MAG: cytochrome C oxidase subunit IV family protein [Acidobacteriota bacterium]